MITIIASITALWSTPSTIPKGGCHQRTHSSPVWAMDGAGAVKAEARDPDGIPRAIDPLDLEVTLHLTKVDLRDLAHFLTDQVGIAVRVDPLMDRMRVSMTVESMNMRDMLTNIGTGVYSADDRQENHAALSTAIGFLPSFRILQAVDGTLVLSMASQHLAGTNPLRQNARKGVPPIPDPLHVVLSNESAETMYSTVMSPFYDKPQPRSPGLPGTVKASFQVTKSMNREETLSLFMNRRPAPLRRPIAPAWKSASMATVLADLSRAAGVTIAMSPRDLADAPSITWNEPVTEVFRVMETLTRRMNLYYTATTRGFLMTSFGREASAKVVGLTLEIPAALADRLISIDVSDADPLAMAIALNKALAVSVGVATLPTARHISLGVQNRSVDDIVKMITICAAGSWSAQLGADNIVFLDAAAAQRPGNESEAAVPVGAPEF